MYVHTWACVHLLVGYYATVFLFYRHICIPVHWVPCHDVPAHVSTPFCAVLCYGVPVLPAQLYMYVHTLTGIMSKCFYLICTFVPRPVDTDLSELCHSVSVPHGHLYLSLCTHISRKLCHNVYVYILSVYLYRVMGTPVRQRLRPTGTSAFGHM